MRTFLISDFFLFEDLSLGWTFSSIIYSIHAFQNAIKSTTP